MLREEKKEIPVGLAERIRRVVERHIPVQEVLTQIVKHLAD